MKYLIILFCVFAFRALGKTKSTCSLDSATAFDTLSKFGDTAGDSSSGDIAGNDRSSGSVGSGSSSGFTGSSSSSDVLDHNDELNIAQDNFNNVLSDGSQIAKDLIKARSLQSRPSLYKRAGFVCSSDETCLSIENEVFCGNEETGDFRSPEGSSGNIITGDYTLADGQEGNLRTGPFPTPASTNGATAPAPSVYLKTGSGNRASTVGFASVTLMVAGASLIAGSLLLLF